MGYKKSKSINVNLAPCQNKTSDFVCKSKEIIDAQLSTAYTAIIFKNRYFSISNKIYKEINLYLKNIDFITDGGFLLKHYLQFKESNEFTYKQNTSNSNLLEYSLRFSHYRDVYSRGYTQIQEIIAQIGGLIKAIRLFTSIFYKFYSQFKFQLFLINEIYCFNETKNSQNIKNNNSTISMNLVNNFMKNDNKTMIVMNIQILIPIITIDSLMS